MDPRFFLPCFHGPSAKRLGHKRKEKTRSTTCRTDRANEANKRYVIRASWNDIGTVFRGLWVPRNVIHVSLSQLACDQRLLCEDRRRNDNLCECHLRCSPVGETCYGIMYI